MRGLATLLPLLLLGACTGTGSPPASVPHASLGVAHDALAQGSAETAIEIARGVLSAHPHDAAALTTAADAEAALGDTRGARRDYDAALAAEPGSTAARRGQAKLRLRDDPRGAETDLRVILAQSPSDAAALTDLGVALDLQERHAEAQASYAAALRASPGLLSAEVDLNLSRALSGHAAEAATALRGVAASGGAGARARADLAVAQTLAGDESEAAITLRADLSGAEADRSIAAWRGLRVPGS